MTRLTRRAALALFSAGLGRAAEKAQSKILPRVGEFFRFADAVTETPVVRLTSLASASFLPSSTNRAVSVRGRFMVFSSDRGGPVSPFHLDLRSGQIAPLLATSSLDVASLSLDGAGKTVSFLDGGLLKQMPVSGKRVQVVAEGVTQFSVGATGQELVYIRAGRLCSGTTGIDLTHRFGPAAATWSQWRPGGAGCLVRCHTITEGEHELWYVPFSADERPSVRLASGKISAPCWSPDGRSVLYQRLLEGENKAATAICERTPEASGVESQVGGASQYAAFSLNGDSSVLVGASRSKAQPTINLLLRAPVREFTLCEHRASHPEACVPVFSGDSRRVYFQSDFQGKPAIYSVNVEALIEETAS